MLLATLAYTQSPEKPNYQAIARDNTVNPLVSNIVNLTFNILQGSSTGAVAYSETHSKTTNKFGLFTAEIVSGAKVSVNNALILVNNANIGIGTSSPTDKLHIENGSLYINKGHFRANGGLPSYFGGGGLIGNDIAGKLVVDIWSSETVGFPIPYITSPSVIITPPDVQAAATQYYVSNVTTTGFQIFDPIGTGSGSFYYQVIEYNN